MTERQRMKLRMILVGAIVLAACIHTDERSPTPFAPSVSRGVDLAPYIVTMRPGRVIDGLGLVQQHGGRVTQRFRYVLSGFAAELPPAAVQALQRNPNVVAIETDDVVRPHTLSWGLDRIDERNLPLSGTFAPVGTGAGVRVYIVDTGIRRTHSDFGGRAEFGADFTSLGDGDCWGHGTHVAGTVGGNQYGVAKAVTLIAVRIFGCPGTDAPESVIIAAVDWVTGNATRPAVVNMSLGGALSFAVNTAVRNSIGSGLTYAISAGNFSFDACAYSPSSVTEALVVGASDITDTRAWFSNHGECVDLFAPGVAVISADITCDDCEAAHSGTSMAAPHVAGAAALYLGTNPTASPATVQSAIVSSATLRAIDGVPNGTTKSLLYVGPPCTKKCQ